MMKLTPTVPTAAMAGAFSAASWPLLWPLFQDPGASSGVGLVAGMLLLVALPAHAFVVGFDRTAIPAGHAVDRPLLQRIGAWLLTAALTAGAMALYRASAHAA